MSDDGDGDNRRQFDEQFVRCQDHLYMHIASLVPDPRHVAELFQQTSLRLLQSWKKYDPQRPFMPWACAVALNEVRMFARRRRRRGQFLSDSLLAAVSEAQFKAESAVDSRLEALSECLEKLPRSRRALVAQCYSGECSVKEIAAGMSLRPQALYKRLERIRRELYLCMEHQHPEEDLL